MTETPTAPVEPLAYSIPQAAAALSVSARQIYILAERHGLPTVKVGGRRLVRVAEMLKTDLRRARSWWIREVCDPAERRRRRESSFLASRDASNRVVDFHALRHTFITRLARSGVTPAVAKSLARHSTIVLTMDYYTHILIEDERAALDQLPSLTSTQATHETLCATGTDGPAALAREAVESPRTATEACLAARSKPAS